MDSTTGRIRRRATAAVASALAAATVLAALVVAPPAPASAGSTRDTEPRTPFPGFVLERGRYRTIEAPDPGVLQYPFDINDRGQITGEYVRAGPDGIPDSESGFLRDKRGRTTVLDVPGAKGTEAIKLNDRGQVVGVYENPDAAPSPQRIDGSPPRGMALAQASSDGGDRGERAVAVAGYDGSR